MPLALGTGMPHTGRRREGKSGGFVTLALRKAANSGRNEKGKRGEGTWKAGIKWV